MKRIGEVNLIIEVIVNPTEDQNKIRIAIQKTFGDLQVEYREGSGMNFLMGKAKGIGSLTFFRSLLRREQIRDAARKYLFNRITRKGIIFYLNKQVALVGHISFSQPTRESPLGSIQVRIECESPKKVVRWLTIK